MKKLVVFIICVVGCLLLGAQNQPVDIGSSVTFGSITAGSYNGNAGGLTNLSANSFSFSGTGAASALTNYTCAFSGTNFLKVVATTNVIFSSFTGGAGNVSYKVVASGGNWTIGWPTNLVTYNTNLLTVAGTNWTFTLTNGHTFRGSFVADTNLTSNPSYTNIDMGWAFSP